jgi:hypothetical protein
LIHGLSFNGGSATGGGILLDDDASTKNAFGTTISNCFFKNCVVTATDGRDGGAIYWKTAGPWQVRIEGNHFYKNVADIVVCNSLASVPQDIVIVDNTFSASPAETDVNLYIGTGGVLGLVVMRNVFGGLPALSTGQVKTFVSIATGSKGILADNLFASAGEAFGAGQANDVPATVFLARNWQEETGGASGEILRT